MSVSRTADIENLIFRPLPPAIVRRTLTVTGDIARGMKGAFLVGSVICLAAVTIAAPSTHAQSQVAVTRVIGTVPASIAVAPVQPVWDLSTILNGPFSAVVTWRIEANVSSVQIMLEASALYKGDDPSNADVAPIPLDTNRPVDISAEHAHDTSGSDRAAWISAGAPIDSFPTVRTQVLTYESSQLGLFSQLVTTRIYYNQQEQIKPMGQYSGRVKITTLIPPTVTQVH